jgi:hypothetical protein
VRLKKYPRSTTAEGKKKFVKSEQEALHEKLDRAAILELKGDVMAAATTEFYKYARGLRTNPWAAHDRMNETMFSM